VRCSSIGLIGKRVVDFLLVLIELFSLGVTVEVLRAKIGRKSAISLQRGQFDPKFQVKGVAATNHSSQKTRLDNFSYGIKMWTDFSYVFFTIHAFDRGTEGRTDTFFVTRPPCIQCTAVIKYQYL